MILQFINFIIEVKGTYFLIKSFKRNQNEINQKRTTLKSHVFFSLQTNTTFMFIAAR